jgi:peptidoglycan/LPS O-acetylase OafA/YrhL
MAEGGRETPLLRYIDCARGYAVLLVISCHLTALFPELPYPVQRVVANGWFGVQLFFIASCLTLLRSWQGEARRHGRNDIVGFFTRRFFRIAPAYYAAGVFYFFLTPPPTGFAPWPTFRTALFVDSWYPAALNALQDPWPVVPGSWSISVEFTFYALFPLYASFLTTWLRAGAILLLTLLAGGVANVIAAKMLTGSLSPERMSNFLYFWFPNQMSVFAVGGIVWLMISALDRSESRMAVRADRLAPFGVASALLGFVGLGFLPVSHYIGERIAVPGLLAASLVFALFLVSLSREPWLFSNRYVAAMGKVSFSAYLIHWAVLDLGGNAAALLGYRPTGWHAIGAYIISWFFIVAIVFVLSWITYRMIEQPMIAVGRDLHRLYRRMVVLPAPRVTPSG